MRKLVNVLKYFLLLGLAVGMMWYALRGISFGLVLDQLGEVNFGWLALALLVSVGSYLSRAYRWGMQLHPLGFPVSLKATGTALMIGYLANLVFPRMGEVLRCTILRRNEGIPVEASFGTVITERVLDLVMLLSLIGLTLIIEFDRLSGFFWGLFSGRFSGLAAHMGQVYVAGAILVLLTGAGGWLLYKYLDQLRQYVFFNKVAGLLKGLGAGVISVRRMERKGLFLLHLILIWGGYFLTTYLVLISLPATAGLGPAAALAIVAIGGLGMSAPVQGGIGVFHLMVSSTLLLYGLTRESGMAFALLLHTSQTLLVVLIGGLSLLISLAQPPHEPNPVPQNTPVHEFGK
ncbi:lysylphosphatidylglycerol synthase transmembrane domain-containing protein [soil metagenome]